MAPYMNNQYKRTGLICCFLWTKLSYKTKYTGSIFMAVCQFPIGTCKIMFFEIRIKFRGARMSKIIGKN